MSEVLEAEAPALVFTSQAAAKVADLIVRRATRS